MGKTQKEVKRVVLDTSVLISALLFKGELSRRVELWKKGKIIPVFSRETFGEFRTALTYPKFCLSQEETESIIQNDILPFFEVVENVRNVKGICRDPSDDKFISCAVSAPATYLVSGDKDLTDLDHYQTIKIVKAKDFLEMFD